MGETAPCTGCQFRSYITSWRTRPLPQHCHLLDAITQASKGYSTCQLLQEDGEYGKTRKAQIMGLLAPFFCCKLVPYWEVKMCVMLSQWIRHSSHKRWVWQKHCSRGSKSITRVRIYSSKNKMLPLLWWRSSSIIILHLSSWLVTWGVVPHCRLCAGLCCWQTECSAVAVAKLALVSRHLCCCAHEYSWSLLPWPFCSRANGQWWE